MKAKFLLLFSLFMAILYFSCGKDNELKCLPAPCVIAESLTDSKGTQENGFAKDIKINQPYETSVLFIKIGIQRQYSFEKCFIQQKRVYD